MEKKVGRYAISNLTLYLLIAYGIGYMTRFLMPELLQWLTLEPGLILKGQIWRIVSWIFVAPAEKPIYFLLMVWLYYSLGTTLERTWGTFRYNVYIISGMLFTVIGAFVLYGVLCATYDAAFIGGQTLLLTGSGLFSVSYIYMSIFLAFAVTYPDMEVVLYFIIPIKMKWMAWVYGAIIVYNMISYVRVGLWVMAVPILASLLNFVLFFFSNRNMHRYNPKEVHRRREFKKAMAQSRVNPATGGITKHKCAICGRTEKDDPNLEFRFCSKCNGNYEYCQDHLFTHQHVK